MFVVEFHFDFDGRQGNVVRERDQTGRVLGRHDAGDLRDRQHVALLHQIPSDELRNFRSNVHMAGGSCDPLRLGFFDHVHHRRPPAVVNVRQLRGERPRLHPQHRHGNS